MNKETILKKLFSVWPNSHATEATVLAYIEALADIPEQELLVVVNQAIRNFDFLPTPVKLRGLYYGLATSISPENASRGWEHVRNALRDPKTWTPEMMTAPKFSDPIVGRTVRAIGWQDIVTAENTPAMMTKFLQMYVQFANSAIAEERLTEQYKQLRSEKMQGIEQRENVAIVDSITSSIRQRLEVGK